ncbi:hypothetical protein ACIQNI_13865 [Streptomyces sp. NPDC091266]|uniref:hypothetical protein n=1 Tax=Streptomyces sp. NPDC091266 TaxID=3365978 RepID=UPI00382A377A
MRRRHVLSRTAGMAGAAAFGLSGCGSGEETGGSVTLKVLAAGYGRSVGSSLVDRWHASIALFEMRHPQITIDLELVPLGKIDKTLAQRVKDGRAPDIAQSYVFADYAEAGQLYRADQLPVTVSASEALRAQASQRPLRPFIDQMPKAEFHPVGRSSRPTVRDALRQRIGSAVAADGDPQRVLDGLQATANAAEAGPQGTT